MCILGSHHIPPHCPACKTKPTCCHIHPLAGCFCEFRSGGCISYSANGSQNRSIQTKSQNVENLFRKNDDVSIQNLGATGPHMSVLQSSSVSQPDTKSVA